MCENTICVKTQYFRTLACVSPRRNARKHFRGVQILSDKIDFPFCASRSGAVHKSNKSGVRGGPRNVHVHVREHHALAMARPPFPTHPSSSLKPSDIFWKSGSRDSDVQSEASSLLRFDVFPFLKKFRNGTDFQIVCFVCVRCRRIGSRHRMRSS